MRIFYTPFGAIAGIVGARLGRRAFDAIWRGLDGGPRPQPTAGDAPLGKVVAAAALEAATMAAIGAVVDRAAAHAFRHLFGAWPRRSPGAPQATDG
jgi:hypothetical protein